MSEKTDSISPHAAQAYLRRTYMAHCVNCAWVYPAASSQTCPSCGCPGRTMSWTARKS